MMKAETVETVEREREREQLFIQHGIRLLDHTHTYVLVNKTGLVFMLKNYEYYVNKGRVY